MVITIVALVAVVENMSELVRQCTKTADREFSIAYIPGQKRSHDGNVRILTAICAPGGQHQAITVMVPTGSSVWTARLLIADEEIQFNPDIGAWFRMREELMLPTRGSETQEAPGPELGRAF